MNEGQALSWLAGHPEYVLFIPLLALCYLCWFLVSRHIPFLMQREDTHRKEVIEALKEVRDAMKGVDKTLQTAVNGGSTRRRESGAQRRHTAPEQQ